MKVTLLTGSRSDWRLIAPLLRACRAEGIEPNLLATGAHLSARHGRTLDDLTGSGWVPSASIPILEETDDPAAIARATARAVQGVAAALGANPPDWLVVAGDRYESFAAGVAATMLRIPIAHVAGGETDLATNQDGNLRNALTKLASVHLVAHELARQRVLALGEEPWRVRVVGLPSLDDVLAQRPTRVALERRELIPRERTFVLCSFLPVTLHPRESHDQLEQVLAALSQLDEVHKLFVLSNADAAGDVHDGQIRAWAAGRSDVAVVPALPADDFLAALAHCVCYVGNSSAGVIEAPALGTPAVIVGRRQAGRPRAANVSDCPEPRAALLANLIRQQIAHGCYASSSPYGDGRAAPRCVAVLRESARRPDLLTKRLVVAESQT